ncbi:hypothetical protein ACLMJK_008317 [Lecanora helva]
MTAQSVDIFLLALSNPAVHAPEPDRTRLNGNGSFELYDDDRVRTLSTNTVSDGADIEGLLYVPDLDLFDPCVNISQNYIPNNVTRKADFPDQQNPLIAFAPWISASCTKSYLAAATAGHVQAFITYLPDNATIDPPLANDESWNLHDGGQWKAQNKFPVYAIPGAEGASVMQQLALYSGNTSNARIAEMLNEERLTPLDYVRLYATFGTDDPSNLPTLWAFLLIILGLVLFIVGATSFFMHFVQRRRRQDLQRRVENGEVNLETLGVKRARISQEAIDSLPTSVYTPAETVPNETSLPASQSSPATASTATPNNSVTDHSQWSQPTCVICLDDFIPKTTTIRSLPCHHIYHPECIDPFLRNNSSLCPLCKTPVLSPDSKFYISEPMTNSMVRQERRARRMRLERGDDMSRQAPAPHHTAQNGRRVPNVWRGLGRRVVSAPGSNPMIPSSGQVELATIERRAAAGQAPTENAAEGAQATNTPSTDDQLRTNWIRRRSTILSGQDRMLSEEETERLARRPRWRKVIDTVFPGFR